MLEGNIQRVEYRLAVVRPVVVAAGVVGGFTESVNTPQLPGMSETFAQHKGAIVAICYSDGAAEDNAAEVRIQPRLRSLVDDEVARETIYVGLDV